MSKRVGELLSQEHPNECSKRRKLNEDANLISIPEFNPGDDWNVHRACLEDCFKSKCIYEDRR